MSNNINKSKSDKSKSPPPLTVCYTNVRGLRGNFTDLEAFMHKNKPDIFALCETNLHDNTQDSDFQLPGYLPIHRKDAGHMHGLGVYAKSNLPIAREPTLEEDNESYMCFRLALLHSTTYIFFLYRSPSSSSCSVVEAVSSNIDKALILHPSANIMVCGDFNAHNTEWLGHSHTTDVAGVFCQEFALAQDLTQIVDFPTQIPDCLDHQPYLLDLFLCSNPDSCTVTSHPPLGRSDHIVVSVDVKFVVKSTNEHPYHRTVYSYSKADWDGLRDHLRDVPWSDIFSHDTTVAAKELSEWVEIGIDCYIPHRKFQLKPHSSPWFTPSCAAAIAHRNHYFHRYHRDGPAFKNDGDRSDPGKYRPISLLSIVSKIFESFINDSLIKHLDNTGLFSDLQYGFRTLWSTADILTVLSERIYNSMDAGGETRAIALDISKAFDKVWHAGLLHKLKSYGVVGPILGILESFMIERSLKVVLDGQSSPLFCINAGVPQGSVLEPTLFLVFINDLPDGMLSRIGIYADDTTLYSSLGKSGIFEKVESAGELERDLNDIVEWGNRWLVTFNATKTKLLSFNRHRDPLLVPVKMSSTELHEETSFRLLGLTFTPTMDWKPYIQSIAKAASRKVGSLFRAQRFLSPESILYLYKSTIRPCMEYCSHIWGGAPMSKGLDILDRVQKRVVNLVGKELCAGLLTLSHRRNVASLCLLYKYYYRKCSSELADLVPPKRVTVRSTRFSEQMHRHTLSLPKCRTGYYTSSFFPRTATIWNSLSNECFPTDYDLTAFKGRVNKFLLQQ